MFYLSKPRFRLIGRYMEDPTCSLFDSSSSKAAKLQFLILLFYNFLRKRLDLPSLALYPHPFLLKRKLNWVHRNRFQLVNWDFLRRYSQKMTKRLRGSLYKKRLFEYKKLKLFYFTLRDKQFRKLARRGVPLYTRYNSHFLGRFEMRLLTLGVRLKLFKNHIQGRQALQHFGLRVGTKHIYYPNYEVVPGNFLGLDNFGDESTQIQLFDAEAFDNLEFDAVEDLSNYVLSDVFLKSLTKFNLNFKFFFLAGSVDRFAFNISDLALEDNIENFNRTVSSYFKKSESLFSFVQNFFSYSVNSARILDLETFQFKPSSYMVISWALKKILLTRYPKFSDLTFPFLVDPVLALSFVSSRI